jgi:tetratricopeptide (TPR) repeat protein
MSFFKNLFSTPKENNPTQFLEGDIFYTTINNTYYTYKMLVIETEYEGYHVLTYDPIDHLPSINDIVNLKVRAYHAPFDKKAFRNAIVLTNLPVKSGDLIGYHEYLKQISEPQNYFPIADKYYQTGLLLTDNKKHNEAIDSYTKAINLFPNFFEAIDNRAFCKMDLALWTEAIADFELSLQVNPISFLAEFSIGECYFRLGDYQKAKTQFEKAHQIDTNDPAPIWFLEKINEKLEE